MAGQPGPPGELSEQLSAERSLAMKLPTLLSLALAALTLAAHAAPLSLYVSPQGRDAAPGSKSAPLATLAGARDRLRALKHTGRLPREGVTVWIRGGTYFQRDTFTLNSKDDLSPVPVTYAAYGGEKVRLTGGQEVTGWKPVTDAAILARLDPAAHGHVLQADLKAQGITDFGQMTPRGFGHPITPAGLELFFGDDPMTLARWPNAGQWARIAGAASDQGMDHFTYEGDRPTRWAKAEDAWVYGYWQFDWADSYTKVAGVDAAHHQLRTAPTTDLLSYTPGHRWYALNLMEELDTPGEWYLDRKTGLLYFWPPSDIRKGHPTVSLTRDLVRLDGVSHVALRGLTLEACRGDAVTIQGGAHNLIDHCTVRSAGNRGATIAGASDSGVRGGEITGTGEGGITLDGGRPQDADARAQLCGQLPHPRLQPLVADVPPRRRHRRSRQPRRPLPYLQRSAQRDIARRQRSPHRVQRYPSCLPADRGCRRVLHGTRLDHARQCYSVQLFS